MYFLEQRIGKVLSELKKCIYSATVPIDEYKIKYTDEKGLETKKFEQLNWNTFHDETWGGDGAFCWFVTEVKIPDDFAGKTVAYELRTGKEGNIDTLNPQFKVFVNGVFIQGLDINHRSIILSENAKPGESYSISLYAYSGTEDCRHLLLESELAVFERKIEKLYYDIFVPHEVAKLLDKNEKDYQNIIGCLNETINMLDLRKPFSNEFYASVDKAQAYITENFYNRLCGSSKVEAWCVGHTHIDVAWLWTLSITKEKALRSFATVLKLMEAYPEYKFMSSQPQLYQYVKEQSPELYEKIKERVKEGRWEPEGGMWVEPDCNMTSGESLIRQILFGKRFFKREFGVDNKVLWLPDVFGFSGVLPQIMKKSEMSYFMTTKLSWNELDTIPYDTFMWEGIDGSKVLAHFISTVDYNCDKADRVDLLHTHMTTYNGVINASQVKGVWDRYQQKDLNNKVLLSFGYGDGGGGPTKEMLEYQRRLEKGIPGCPKTVISRSKDYFNELENEVKGNPHLPTWTGGLYLEYHRGTYTSIARTKKFNRKSEFLFENTELMCSMDKILNNVQYPQKRINDSITVMLRNQFHDILPGSAIKDVYEDSKHEYESIFKTGNELLFSAAEHIVSQIDSDGDAIVVFNPLGFDASDVVTFTIPRGIVNPSIISKGKDGVEKTVDCQIINKTQAIFFAQDVPAKGYRTYLIRDGAQQNSRTLSASKEGFSTDFFDVKFNEKGQFSSIYDKRANREVIRNGMSANILRAYEDIPTEFDAWNIDIFYKEKSWEVDDLQSAEVEECGSVRGCIKLTYKLLDSTIVQYVTFYRDIARIDIRNEIDWKEKHLFLRTSFPVDIHCDEATYEIQYGNIKLPTHTNTSWDAAKFEVCAHKWMDYSEDGYGVSILNDCKYGCDIHNGVMSLSLIKSSTYPNVDADREHHEFVYSIYPHESDWKSANTEKAAYLLNNPLFALEKPAGKGALPQNYSFIRCNAENVIIEVVKKAEDSDDIVIRMYEYFNRRTNVTITCGFDVKEVKECNLLEHDSNDITLQNRSFTVEIKPYEIKTYKIKVSI